MNNKMDQKPDLLQVLRAHGTCASLHIGSRFKSQALLDEKALAACGKSQNRHARWVTLQKPGLYRVSSTQGM